MKWVPRPRRWWMLLLAVAVLWQSAGCGTILHPERRGQPAGRLDWGIVALNAVGLCFFFVPGVIAFAVDFTNGTIYLPPEGYGSTAPPTYRTYRVDPAELSAEKIEQVVREQTGQTVQLDTAEMRPVLRGQSQ